MSYRSVSVTVQHDDTETTIASSRSEDEILLSCTGTDTTEPLRVPILKPDAYELRNRFLDRQRDFYREQEALNSRHPMLRAIEKLPTPMFLDLERRHQEGTRIRRGIRYGARTAPVNPLAGSLMESLSDAQALAEMTHREFLATRTHLTDSLKQDLILAAFRQVKNDYLLSFWNERPEFLQNLANNERVVLDSLTKLGISASQLDKVVRQFFDHVRITAAAMPAEQDFLSNNVTAEAIQSFQDWSALQPQIQQINIIAGRIARYNREIARQFDPIERYLHSVNRFLNDGKKRIGFDDAGNLRVFVGNEIEGRTVTSLSSGERQLVVILTHLAFNTQAKRANILIIDEPELSLHLRWQESFVDAVIAASPGLQLVLATHSPSIIKGKIYNCIDVEEARRDDRLFS